MSLADALAASGIHRIFAAAPADEAFEGRTPPVVETASAAMALLLAAVTGDLEDAPAAVVLGPEDLASVQAPLAWARLDRAPLLVLVRRAAAGAEGPGPELAWRSSFKAVAPLPSGHAAPIAAALALALRHPRGPVRVDLDGEAGHGGDTSGEIAAPDPAALDAAADLIARASRPVVVAGIASRWGEGPAWLRPFAESLPAPVLVTLRAKGTLADPHPLALGLVVGPAAPALLARADLVVALGIDPVEPGPEVWCPQVPVLALAPAGPAVAPDRSALEVKGQVSSVLAELAWRLRGRTQADWDVAELDRLRRAEWAAAAATAAGRIARTAREMTVAGTVAAVEAGHEAEAVARAWHAVSPRDFLAPAVLAPPGFAPAVALAAALLRPDVRALAFVRADGLATAAEALALAAVRDLPVTIVALGGGMASSAAAGGGGAVPGAVPGTRHYRVAGVEAFPEALASALARRGPAVIEVAPV